jgi:hypothetical protein
MTPIKVFYLERTNMVRQYLRRYTRDGGECGDINNYGYHNKWEALADQVEVPEMPEDEYHVLETNTSSVDEHGMIGPVAQNDPRWPTRCHCGYAFADTVGKQYFPERLYRRVDTGELTTLRDAPVGAMWHTDYTGFNGPDGKSLHVRIWGTHDWMVDSRASNCDSPCKHCGKPYHSHDYKTCPNKNPGGDHGFYEDSRPHACWVRHGDPKTGNVHVDKNGVTCGAGAGSIVVPGFHGFLHNGHIVSC